MIMAMNIREEKLTQILRHK